MRVYVGETGKLVPHRLKNYLAPEKSQKTNIRLKAVLDQSLAAKCQIEWQIVKIRSLSLNGKKYTQNDLKSQAVRRSLEHLLIRIHVDEGFEMLNKQF